MTTYLIQSGDTLSKLASKFGTTIQDLLKENSQITDPNKIFAGDTLNVPKTLTPLPEKTLEAEPKKELPEVPKSRLVAFEEGLDKAMDLARQKRQRLLLETASAIGKPGEITPDSFISLMQAFNNPAEREIATTRKGLLEQFEKPKAKAEDLNKLSIDAAEGGAPDSLLREIINAESYSDAILKAAPYLRKKSVNEDAEKQVRLKPINQVMTQLVDPGTGYIKATAYRDAYKIYIKKNPGRGKEFMDEFPIEMWLNEGDRYSFKK